MKRQESSIKLSVLGSGSSGNCYILKCGEEKLIIECGVPMGDITEMLDYSMEGVSGCIVTHVHTDHLNNKTARELRVSGVSMYGSKSVADKFGWVYVLPDRKVFSVGSFKVMSLPVPHGDCPCSAFVIDAPDGQRVLFATDLERLPYTVRGVNHLLIEANYSEDILMERLLDNEDVRSKSDTHLEIEETVSTVSRHAWSGLKSVLLLHLSHRLSDATKFKSMVENVLSEKGIVADVAVARRGLVRELRLYPWE